HWISLKGRTRAEARQHLLEQLVLLLGSHSSDPVTFSDVASEYAENLGSGLLVLDDVPDVNADSLLADRLNQLIRIVSVSGQGHVLITGHAPLSAQFAVNVGR